MKYMVTFGISREIELDSMRPSRILHHILEEVEDSKEYLYLICGQNRPTGKTWLCEGLKKYGYNAFEITEDIWDYFICLDDFRNHYYINPDKKLVLITLNERLKKEARGE